MDGKTEIIAVEAMENESEATYTEFFNKLKARGLEKCGCAFLMHMQDCRQR